MTSINNLMNTTSTSSIYGNRNIISGLASGMDTETMIENAVKGYQSKITSLQQKQEQVQWKQEAYRSIIDKMVNLTRKYTSYTSSTNLFSQSFFNQAVTLVTNGANASKVSAIGKTSSDIQINGVKQLAQAARRAMNVGNTALAGAVAKTNDDGRLVVEGQAFDLSGKTAVSKIAGGMTLKYGASSVYLNFSEGEAFKDTQELADAIQKKLDDAQLKTGKGDYVKASDRIKVVVNGDKITFEDKAEAGNNIAITGATKSMENILGFTAGDKATSMTVKPDQLSEELDTTKYLSNKEVSFTLDGVTKTVSLGEVNNFTDIKNNLQTALDKQFGKGKVQVGGSENDGLKFDVANGSSLTVTSSVGEALGIGEKGLSTALDTSKTLKELGMTGLFDDATSTQEASVNLSDLIKLSGEKIKVTVGGKDYNIDLGEVEYTAKAEDVAKTISDALKDQGVDAIKVSADANGKINFTADGATSFEITSSNTKKADIYTKSTKMQELTVNGTSVGKFSEDSTLSSVMNAINNSDTGVKISYSRMTNEFSMVAKETGANSEVSMSGNLAKMFGFGGDMDKFSQFENDELGMLGLSSEGLTATTNSKGEITGWTNADGKEVARRSVDKEGNVSLLKFDDTPKADGNPYGWTKVAQMSKDGNKLEMFDHGKLIESYQKVKDTNSDNGAMKVQKAEIKNGAVDSWKTIGSVTDGQDAIFTATVNGSQMELTRSSNTVDMDGMKVTLQGTFGEYETVDGKDKFKAGSAEAVTFTTSADNETIVSAIRDFVKDYNEMVKEIHDAYRTQPNEKSSKDHSRYLPLTEEDKKGMSDSAIEAYEEKAKKGLLFGSTELSNLYRQLTSAIQNTSLSMRDMEAIGLKTSYSNGLTTLELDENKLNEALNTNPDKVRDVFAKSADNGSGSDGLMANMKTVLDAYANTSSGSMGILIQQAGSSYSPSSVNSNYLQKQYDEFTSQIEKWQTKMSDKVDYYTRQFTALEQLVAQMNNQSSMLAGLQGGY